MNFPRSFTIACRVDGCPAGRRLLFLRFQVSALLGLVALVITGCGGTSGPVVRDTFVEFTPDQVREIDNAAVLEYRIQEGDILKIAFSYERNLTQEGVVVLADGAVNLVGVDRLVLAGLTLTQADSLITQAYAGEYRDPDLSIIVMETQGRKVYVIGEVQDPGLHRVPTGGFDLLGAVSVAGGFTPDAAKDGVVLVRVTQSGYLAQEFNLGDFDKISAGQLATVSLRPYDVVYVPRSKIGDFSYFARSVLAGVISVTKIATDLKYMKEGGVGRY